MGQIKLLDKITIDKIAAGEVIERPAAVVKELVENAIDAGASTVTIEIKEGGIAFIRITDNGCGISKEDIPNAFLRHSTSKIRGIEDLMSINSLGFRGEALSSVSSVAQVELLTKCSGTDVGNRYVINGGIEECFEDAALNDGTTFIIRQLFYNIPARRKFLKTASTEASHVSDLVTRLALSHPNVSFQFINNGVTKLHTTGSGSIKDMIYSIYGRDIASNLLDVNVTTNNIKMTGFIGKPVVSRGNRNYQNYFINGRYVKSGIISKAIEDAYKGYAMQHRYPFTVLHIEMDTSGIDINVHPTKMDLRFSEQNTVYNHIHFGIAESLEQRDEIIPKLELPDAKLAIQTQTQNTSEVVNNNTSAQSKLLTNCNVAINPNNRINTNGKNIVSNASGFTDNKIICKPHKNTNRYGSSLTTKQESENLDYFLDKMKGRVESYHQGMSSAEVSDKNQVYKVDSAIQQTKINEAISYAKANIENSHTTQNKAIIREVEDIAQDKANQLNLFGEQILELDMKLEYRLIGQVFGTYWMIEYDSQLYIIDQHAAHEKVLYENTINGWKTKEFSTQAMSPPIILTLTMHEQQLLKKHMSEFTAIGFELESFGIDTFAIRGVPANLLGIASQELFIEMLDELDSISIRNTPSELITEKVASMSCKAAVKGNSNLSAIEVDNLIGDLLRLDNPFHCPHGRPVIISMTKKEMEKKFKRII